MYNIRASSYLLTCTFHATSTVAIVTTAAVAPFCVSAAGILMTIVQASILTFINICMETEMTLYSVSDSLYSRIKVLSPLQFNPFSSSWYPVSQLQVKLPMVLVQLRSQPPFEVVHSLISIEEQTILRSLVTGMYNRYILIFLLLAPNFCLLYYGLPGMTQ